MLLKGIFCLGIEAVLFMSVFTQCIPPFLYPREPLCPTNSPFVKSYNSPSVAPIATFGGRVIGGNIIIDTSAPYAYIGPAGVTIFSDNLIIEGAVLVSGNLPFVGTAGLEGTVPAAGNSAVSYACGTSDIDIVVTEVVLPADGIGTLGCGGLRL